VQKKCPSCQEMFPVYAHIPNQCYCSKHKCQNERRQQWRKKKMALDKAYKANQYDAQKRWCQKNKDYWRCYRELHPEYVEHNRQLQKIRNQRRKGTINSSDTRTVIAKRYVLNQKNIDISGYYKLTPAGPQMIAKSDVLLVKLDFISTGYPQGP